MRGLLALPSVLNARFDHPAQLSSTTRETVEIDAADGTRAQCLPLVMTFRGQVPACGHGSASSIVHVLSLQRVPLGLRSAFPKMWIRQADVLMMLSGKG